MDVSAVSGCMDSAYRHSVVRNCKSYFPRELIGFAELGRQLSNNWPRFPIILDCRPNKRDYSIVYYYSIVLHFLIDKDQSNLTQMCRRWAASCWLRVDRRRRHYLNGFCRLLTRTAKAPKANLAPACSISNVNSSEVKSLELAWMDSYLGLAVTCQQTNRWMPPWFPHFRPLVLAVSKSNVSSFLTSIIYWWKT
jgi:hypothetical protein